MICDNCGSDKAHVYRIVYGRNGQHSGCNICDGVRPSPVYDVYLGPSGGIQTDPNLCDPKTGKEIPFSTKGEKKAIMDRLGVRQAPSAERQHGYRREEYRKKTYFT